MFIKSKCSPYYFSIDIDIYNCQSYTSVVWNDIGTIYIPMLRNQHARSRYKCVNVNDSTGRVIDMLCLRSSF